MAHLDIHADDFAVSVHASQEIIRLCREGKLNSISILPNMSCFGVCMELLHHELAAAMPEVSVHLNFMEGPCLSPPQEIPDLVDQKGLFSVSWGGLLKSSWMPVQRDRILAQLKKEILRQLMRVKRAMTEGYRLRIDSHQHTHMIPVVFRALCEVVEENRLDIAFIRNSGEPLAPFFRCPSLYASYSPVNLVKNMVIGLYAPRVGRAVRSMGLPDTLLWGIVMSGRMDGRRVAKLLPQMERYANQKNRPLEILFHPGSVRLEEIGEEYGKKGFVAFHLSEGRRIEYEAVAAMKQGKMV